jgi:hypothetical protein
MKLLHFAKILHLRGGQVLVTKECEDGVADPFKMVQTISIEDGPDICIKQGFRSETVRDIAFDNYGYPQAENFIAVASSMVEQEVA